MLGFVGSLSAFHRPPRRLAQLLYWDRLAAPGVLRQKDGSLLAVIQFRGPDMASSGPYELLALSAKANHLLRGFTAGWGLHLEARRLSATAYPVSAWPDPVSGLLDEERRATFEAPHAHFESTSYLTLTYKPASRLARQAQRWLWSHLPHRSTRQASNDLTLFRAEVDRTAQALHAFCPTATVLDDAGLLTFLHGCVSPKRHPVAVPHPPAFLDTYLTDTDLTGGILPRLGTAWLRTLAVHAYPEHSYPGIVEALERLELEYRYVLRYLPLNRATALRQIRSARRTFLQGNKRMGARMMENFSGHTSGMIEQDQVSYAAQAGEAMAAVQQGQVAFGYCTATVTVWDADFDRAEDKRQAVEQVLNNQGFSTKAETLNAVQAWLSALPGDHYHNVRKPLLHSLNLSHLAPLTSLWSGPTWVEHLDGPPLLYTTGAGQTPFRLSPYDGDLAHTWLFGPPGAGKSMLLALLALQWRRYQNASGPARVHIYDKGGSAKCATRAVGGAWYRLAAGGDLALQPLRGIDDLGERSWCTEWVLDLMEQEQVRLTPVLKTEVFAALSVLASSPPVHRTLTGLQQVLQDQTLRAALQPYTQDGPFGSLLDGDRDPLTLGHWQCFEMEQLFSTPRILPAVLSYCFHRTEMTLDGAPTLIEIDEAGTSLDAPTFGHRMATWAATLRKKNAALVLAAQSLGQSLSVDATGTLTGIAATLIDCCPTRIYLANPHALEPMVQRLYSGMGLTATQCAAIAAATPKQDYYFSSRLGQRWFRLEAGPVTLALCGKSDAESLRQIDAVWAEDPATFAPRWLAQCGLQEAAHVFDIEGVAA